MSQHPAKLKHLLSPYRNRDPRVIAEGKVRTYDMGGKDSTVDVAKVSPSTQLTNKTLAKRAN